ncbi:unnamed protein product [Zymoseptoria tritici ST99CH_1A5]|uniref:Uncharacterized protein n=2 Tax=Zymoseptoria tritici TaxID=1047171 RepID=A0A2H1H826_ZYMTR|nr:unnamed protein product [Zymoseptoria tritici ST99CH_1E4]SMR64477.1 unnamed protein product [Zymoseptoria tritici ST99CH_3D1]SMY29820.1 unnamed protein product [Zymoseptoria tritici ST99CH_1A5]
MQVSSTLVTWLSLGAALSAATPMAPEKSTPEISSLEKSPLEKASLEARAYCGVLYDGCKIKKDGSDTCCSDYQCTKYICKLFKVCYHCLPFPD